MTENNLLSTIFQDKYSTPDYEELLNDKSIKGKFKYIMNYSPSSLSKCKYIVHYNKKFMS